MPTTAIRLPEDLKARVAAAAKRSGTTTHGFILEAIAEKTKLEDLRADFDAVLGIQPPNPLGVLAQRPRTVLRPRRVSLKVI